MKTPIVTVGSEVECDFAADAKLLCAQQEARREQSEPDVAFSFATLYVLDVEPTQLLSSRA